MQLKISSTWSLLVISIVGITCSSIVIAHAVSIRPLQDTTFVSTMPAISGFPILLLIPKINVSAPVEDLGLTSLGAMAVPVGPIDVAWYDLGPRPGEIGSAVIVGHEGWKDGIAAVFDNLNKLVVGDKIYVTNDAGTTTEFVVRQTLLYGEHDSASVVFNSNDGLAHLNLITCDGIWNAITKSYSDRLVVFTDRE